jgi:nucleoid DNA-binding protein
MDYVLKEEFISYLSKKLKISYEKTHKFVDGYQEAILENLLVGNNIMFKKFGKFTVFTNKSRNRTNPKTKEVKMMPEKKVLKFKFSNHIKVK